MGITDLENKALEIRKLVVKSLTEAGSGHLGGSLGLADIFSALYFNIMNHNPKDPEWEDRDRLILSIGHVAPVLYSTLALAGYFPVEEMKTLRKLNSRLQGHPATCHKIPGLETSAGSLGQGLSIAVGMALSAKINKKNGKVFSIHGDGELQEGSVWEAAMSASHHKLDNLIAIVDRNECQIDGKTKDVMELEPLSDKWRSFGWDIQTCDGNNMTEILNTFDKISYNTEKPTVIIARTKMGKGIKSIEDNYLWHGKVPDPQNFNQLISELN